MSLPTGSGWEQPNLPAYAPAPAAEEELPNVLLSYQVEALKEFDETEFLVIEKSRRTGISYGFAAYAVLKAAPAERPQNVYYLAYNLDMTREFIGYCADFAKAFDEVASAPSEFLFDDGSEKGIKALRIDFPSGKAIVALSSKPRSLRGMQGIVIIDEAAFHDELAEVHKAAMALTMWGGKVVMISTHNGDDNAFNTFCSDIRGGKLEGKVFRLTLEDALKQGLYQRICLRTGETWTPEGEAEWERKLRKRYGEAAEEELDVVPARGSGTYLPRATIEAVMTDAYPVLRLTCPTGFELQDQAFRTGFVAEWLEEHVRPLLEQFDQRRRSYFGQDFARSGDLSVIAAGQEDEQLQLHARIVIEMRNVPFREQRQVLDFIARGMPLFTAAKMDGRGNGQQLAEEMGDTYGRDRVESVMATQKTYLTCMPRMKARIEDRTFLIPRHEGVLDDLRLVKLVKGIPMVIDRSDDKTDGAKGKRHGDSAIALMNLVAAVDTDIQPLDHLPAGQERSSGDTFETTGRGFGTVSRQPSQEAFHVPQ
jgi:phage FluMu gp28-like protein